MSFAHLRINAAALQPAECADLRRLGSPHDGGYVVPVRAIERASALLSFGLGFDWTFERDALALNPGLIVHVYDHTVGPGHFAKAALSGLLGAPLQILKLSPRRFMRSIRKFKRSCDYFRFFRGRVRHFKQRVWFNEDGGSAPVETIIARAGVGGAHSIFAKVDIEGSEYRILPAIADRASSFSGLVVEFHDTDICAAAFDEVIEQLRREFEIVHVHGNNYADLSFDRALPICWEITLLHKNLLDGPVRRYSGPLPRPGLDAPNHPLRPDYALHLTTETARDG